MSHSKLIEIKEIESIACGYIDEEYRVYSFKHVLDYVGSDYDYIFEILHHDILVGDLNVPARQFNQSHSILRDDT